MYIILHVFPPKSTTGTTFTAFADNHTAYDNLSGLPFPNPQFFSLFAKNNPSKICSENLASVN